MGPTKELQRLLQATSLFRVTKPYPSHVLTRKPISFSRANPSFHYKSRSCSLFQLLGTDIDALPISVKSREKLKLMERNGGYCIARYDGGGAYDLSKVDKMMQRFRPIAPKPAISATVSFPAANGDVTPENSELSVKNTHRGRRKSSVKVNKPYRTSRKKKIPVKTLSFFSETPEEKPKRGGLKEGFPTWLSFEDCSHVTLMVGHVGVGRAAPPPEPVVGSWVKVECVIDEWYGGVRCTDEERLTGLDLDTCPGLITDRLNNVIWTNAAYKKMVDGEGEVGAWVVVEEGVALPLGCAAFTCRVRVVTCGKEKGYKMVACDVWRMGCGGFAWRLDTMTALCLGR